MAQARARAGLRLALLATLAALGCVWFRATAAAFNVLIIGGTRFSGAYLWSELRNRGHSVTLYNRGKTAPKKLPRESDGEFAKRVSETKFLTGDRKDPAQLKSLIDPKAYDYVYDMNGRERSDTEPLAEIFKGSGLKQLVYMSSAGVYLKGDEMPHLETQAVDPNSRHKGKLDTEEMLRGSGLPWCSFRPTYITGPQNYNPVERYFLARVDAGRPVCIPGHGQHLTGLGHVEDLAIAMANVIGREDKTTGQVYNLQAETAVSFDGMAKAAAKAMGKPEPQLIHYDAKAVKDKLPEKKKAFPLREQHFWTGVGKAKKDLEWTPKYNSVEEIFRDGYENDFKLLKADGSLKVDFECDDCIVREVGQAAPAASGQAAPAASAPAPASISASSFAIGDKVTWNGKPGVVRHSGQVQFAPGDFVGVELEGSGGMHDGTVMGVEYFKCGPKKGIFAPPSMLSKLGAPVPPPPQPTPAPVAAAPAPSAASAAPAVAAPAPPPPPVQVFTIGARVLFDGRHEATVRYVGDTQFASGTWYGLELDSASGVHDGTVLGVEYFKVGPKKGAFAGAEKLRSL